MLALVAAGSISFGALCYCIVASDADLSFAVIRVMGGTVFSLGLVIVMIGGAELLTGNNLIVMAWASGEIPTVAVLRNWLIVYIGNFVGAAGLAAMVIFSHNLDMNGGRTGLTILTTAAAKISPDIVTLFVKGVLCNLLVAWASGLLTQVDPPPTRSLPLSFRSRRSSLQDLSIVWRPCTSFP
jgi:formate transporter